MRDEREEIKTKPGQRGRCCDGGEERTNSKSHATNAQ